MSSTDSTNQKAVAAFVGIDWADQKHAIVLRAATSAASLEHRSIGAEPDALAEWVLEVRERFASAGRIVVCLEQSRGALIHFLMGYECFELYPINPQQLASYREDLRPSGAKDDPIDGEKRRQAVDARSALSNQLKSELKQYYPLALAVLDNDLTTALAADFLLQWPHFESLKKTAPHKLRKFFYGHQCRSEQKLQARLERIEAAQPLTRDSAIIEAGTLTVQMLAQQLKALVPYIARYEKEIAQLFEIHPDSALFNNLPGAGPTLGPRLLAAFGTDRERFQSPLDAVTFFGVAPVTEESGKSRWVHFRWACPKFLRQSFHEFAAQSIRFCDWAAVYYQQQRARGKGHHAAVRALAYKWIRILFRCWKTHQPYDPQLYLTALLQRGSPYTSPVKNSSPKT